MGKKKTEKKTKKSNKKTKPPEKPVVVLSYTGANLIDSEIIRQARVRYAEKLLGLAQRIKDNIKVGKKNGPADFPAGYVTDYFNSWVEDANNARLRLEVALEGCTEWLGNLDAEDLSIDLKLVDSIEGYTEEQKTGKTEV